MSCRTAPLLREPGASDDLQFHLLSFEGPDPYSRAGGLASRVVGLTEALSSGGRAAHLWFVGDPDLPGHETHDDLHLHRWCQWISRNHPGGVYEGEEAKRQDFGRSIPPYLFEHGLRPHLEAGGRAVVMAEEWHTAEAVQSLDAILREHGLRERVSLLWNANNTFGFDRIDWPRLEQACMITTVSRYMKHRMWSEGVDPLAIPNGLGVDAFIPAPRSDLARFQQRFIGRTALAKMARWDPDKRWLLAIDIVAGLKRVGSRPILLARGGAEPHSWQVIQRARACGLRIAVRTTRTPGAEGLLEVLDSLDDVDLLVLDFPLDAGARRVLLRGSDVVLANSGHEPFGLVGLETMAVGGLACTGYTGEDYAIPGNNAIVMQTNDPQEFVYSFEQVQAQPEHARTIRREGRRTARRYSWPRVIDDMLLPQVGFSTSAGAGPVAGSR